NTCFLLVSPLFSSHAYDPPSFFLHSPCLFPSCCSFPFCLPIGSHLSKSFPIPSHLLESFP
ncbi:unnamed protein product, partial [Closterium sp. Naga37s-1]